MAEPSSWTCHACANIGLADGSDGFYYCLRCGAQADDIIDTGVADEDFVNTAGGIYLSSNRRRPSASSPFAVKAEPLSQSQPQSQFWSSLTQFDADVLKPEEDDEGFIDGLGPTEPSDFGSGGAKGLSYEDYYNEVRMRYVMGMQLILQYQCEALVERFKVNPLICGMSGTIWLRFVASTRIFEDNWADEAINDSESQRQGEPEGFKHRAKYSAEPHNLHGQRAVMVWFRSLRKRIPLACSLAISFLICHIAREAVLPTDIVKWSLEGKLPYFADFLEIDKQMGPPSKACPISSQIMFRPSQAVPLQKLESMAASIAESIGLHLPPVNFYAIGSRYINQLSLPMEKIIPHACRIQEWSVPPDLWLSTNELRLPTRVCVMAILIVSIRILCNIHGFGAWEKSLSSQDDPVPGRSDHTRSSKTVDDVEMGSDSLDTEKLRGMSQFQNSELDASELLHNLEARYNDIVEPYEYSKNLPTYLNYCKDVVFAGLEPSFENYEEQRMIEQLWKFFENQKDFEAAGELQVPCNGVLNKKRSNDDGYVNSQSKENKRGRDQECLSDQSADNRTSQADDGCSQQSPGSDPTSPISHETENSDPNDQAASESFKEKAIRKLKVDMEENRFCYIPPRVNLKRFGYLHYVRKKDDGALTYVAHADYYILLRACAKAAQVDIRTMHAGVLSLERRLAWLENRIDHCLHLTPPNVPEM